MSEHDRSFEDALTLKRNKRDQATIYYHGEDGTHAAYDVSNHMCGEMYVNGRALTIGDAPDGITIVDPNDGGSASPVVARNAATAKSMFQHNGVDVERGWNVRP